MASTKYNVVYRSGAGANSPVPSYYTCGTVAEISGAVAGDLAYETTNNRVMKYSGSAWELLVPTPPFVRTDVINLFTALQYISMSAPRIYFQDLDQPANAKLFDMVSTSQVFRINPVNDVGSSVANGLSLNRGGDISIGRDIYEKGRTTPLGHWITIPYNAANFTASSGSWNVAAGDLATAVYTVIGKTMLLAYTINTSSVTVATTYLFMAIPPGFSVAYTAQSTNFYTDPTTSGWKTGMTVGGNPIQILKDPGGTAWSVSTDATYIQGTAIIPLL